MSANSAQECMEQISEAAMHIRTLLEELPHTAATRVTAEEAFRRSYARALVTHRDERTDICKALAEIDTEQESLAAEQAKAAEKRCKEALHSWRSILSALQTVSGGYREEAKFARTGPGSY